MPDVIFEWILGILLGAVLLSALAQQIKVPYPALLALGGAVLAFIPGAPRIALDPELALALFVAPVLLDAAYDTSPRDLRDNWLPVTCLVLVAVGLTTGGVAVLAHALTGMPWAAAIALGAIVAPPDAAAATAVLRQVNLPHRIVTILEGESLLNDASALLIYRMAVIAVSAGSLTFSSAAPMFLLSVVGSIIAGPLLAIGLMWLADVLNRSGDTPTAIILQFIGTFGVWLLADRLGLSGILTIVAFAITIARRSPARLPARIRVPSYAVWETAVFVLNVLAFMLIGLQIGPIFEGLAPDQRVRYLTIAAAVLAAVILIRFAWVMSYNAVIRWRIRRVGFHPPAPDVATHRSRRPHHLLVRHARHRHAGGGAGFAERRERPGLSVSRSHRVCGVLRGAGDPGHSGLDAAAAAAQARFARRRPGRERGGQRPRRGVQGCACVVGWRRIAAGRSAARRAEGCAWQANGANGGEGVMSLDDGLRLRTVNAARQAILTMRSSGEIGDAAFHRVEEEIDRLELSAA